MSGTWRKVGPGCRIGGDYASCSLLASVGIAMPGTRLASDADSNQLLLAVPVAQIVSSVLIERATSRWKASPHQ